jgi:uncharacterized cofD-like protein
MNIVGIGGGHGLAALTTTLLPAIQKKQIRYSAIVAMTDSGATTARCREAGFPGVGDGRRIFMALSREPTDDWETIDRRGWKKGNWEICKTIARYEHDVAQAFRVLNQRLGTYGEVIPTTPEVRDLRFIVTHGEPLVGEGKVPELTVNNPIQSVGLNYPAMATPAAVLAIQQADLVILGPGSVYTSVAAALLPIGIAHAIAMTKATVLYICNISTERGELIGGVAKHIRTIKQYAHRIDYCLVNNNVTAFAKDPQQEGSVRHITTKQPSIDGTKIQAAYLRDEAHSLNHDPEKLLEALQPFFAKEVQ